MISSWYSETICGWVGVIFAIASRAMKRTAVKTASIND